mmetsp:Transcript_15688/g.39857  ORF Transcript_15688/g.39857 Transcript_15688/m.39857 type:complete len:230 (+) Transcript_15688:213-902(+)
MRRGRTTTSRLGPTRSRLPSTRRRRTWRPPTAAWPSTRLSSTATGSIGTPTSSSVPTTPRAAPSGTLPMMRAAAASPITPTPRTTTRCSRTFPPPPTAPARRAGTTTQPALIRSCAAATWESPPRSTPSPFTPSALRPPTAPARLPAPRLRTTCLRSTLAPSARSRRRGTSAPRCSRARLAMTSAACGSQSSRRAPRPTPPPSLPSQATLLPVSEPRCPPRGGKKTLSL